MDHSKPIKHIHLIGIAGTGMGAFAGLLKKAGYTVTGSDAQTIYPPMSDKLKEWDIPVKTPYSPANLQPHPDLVIVGNVASKDNVEAVYARDARLNYTSFPDALKELFLKNHDSVVVAGTHGKTTSSALLAFVLHHAGYEPSFLIGGILQNFGESFRLGKKGGFFVIEGDEYDTAYFDKGPKFLHYCPQFLLATSLEYDHADIYQNVEQIQQRFTELFQLVPQEGRIVAFAPAGKLQEALKQAHSHAPITTYGPKGQVQAANISENEELSFDVVWDQKNQGQLRSTLMGQHSIDNILGCYALLTHMGLSHQQIADGVLNFKSVKRRMEEVGQANGHLVIDDFAHHPTAVATTIAGAKKRYPGKPIWAFFEPRSASSCRKVFQDDYAKSFTGADRVLLAPPGRMLDPSIMLDVNQLAADVSRLGVPATAFDSIDAMIKTARTESPKQAVFLCMSNGAFGSIHQKLLAAFS